MLFCRRSLSALALLIGAGRAGVAAPYAPARPPETNVLSSPLRGGDTSLGEADGLVAECLLLFALGSMESAKQACSGALLLDPKRADAFKLRGYVYLLEGRPDKAGADFQAGLRLKPTDDQLWAGYGQTLNDMGRFAEAVGQFHKAVQLAPEKPAYWSSLCWTQAATGEKLDEALAACSKALRLAPQAAAPYNSRGLVRLRMRQWPEAIADYRQSLRLSSEQASAWFGLGLARLSAGDAAGAADIRDARQRDPAIDWLFIAMDVLPERCDLPTKAVCPAGFPALPKSGGGLIAKAQKIPKQQILRLAGF